MGAKHEIWYFLFFWKRLTWRPQLGLAGWARQRQTLAKPVHPVEADGDIGVCHGLQILSWGKGYPTGLVSENRLCGAESCHTWCASLWGRRREVGKEKHRWCRAINELTPETHVEQKANKVVLRKSMQRNKREWKKMLLAQIHTQNTQLMKT